MAHDVTCACGKKLRVADEHAGRQGRCPLCQRVFLVPTGGTAIQPKLLPRTGALQSPHAATPIVSHSNPTPPCTEPASLLRPAQPFRALGVGIISCVGGIFGGCLVVAIQSDLLDFSMVLWTAVAIGLLACAALILVSQRPSAVRNRISWHALGLGLAAVVLVLCLAAAGVWAFETLVGCTWGEKLVFGGGDEVYYNKDATAVEAQRLGQFLQDDGYFDRPETTSVQLSRVGEHVVVSFVVARGAWGDPEVISSYRSLGDDISTHLFAGRPVQVRLCDERRMVQKKIN